MKEKVYYYFNKRILKLVDMDIVPWKSLDLPAYDMSSVLTCCYKENPLN